MTTKWRMPIALVALTALGACGAFKGGGKKTPVLGDRVPILGPGHYAGVIAVIERMANGALPSAAVRTEAGRARTVRTVDLEPAG